MGLKQWWKAVPAEHKLVMLILVMGMILLAALVLFSGCIATTEFVQAECARTAKIAEKRTWDAIGETEAERARVDPENKSAKNVQLFALTKSSKVKIPAATPATTGWAGMLGVAGTILIGLGVPGGYKLRSMSQSLAAQKQTSALYSQAIGILKDKESPKWKDEVAPMLRAHETKNGKA